MLADLVLLLTLLLVLPLCKRTTQGQYEQLTVIQIVLIILISGTFV